MQEGCADGIVMIGQALLVSSFSGDAMAHRNIILLRSPGTLTATRQRASQRLPRVRCRILWHAGVAAECATLAQLDPSLGDAYESRCQPD